MRASFIVNLIASTLRISSIQPMPVNSRLNTLVHHNPMRTIPMGLHRTLQWQLRRPTPAQHKYQLSFLLRSKVLHQPRPLPFSSSSNTNMRIMHSNSSSSNNNKRRMELMERMSIMQPSLKHKHNSLPKYKLNSRSQPMLSSSNNK